MIWNGNGKGGDFTCRIPGRQWKSSRLGQVRDGQGRRQVFGRLCILTMKMLNHSQLIGLSSLKPLFSRRMSNDQAQGGRMFKVSLTASAPGFCMLMAFA
jgi:hypothetical protein